MTGNVVSGSGLDTGYTSMLMSDQTSGGAVMLGHLTQQSSDLMGSTYMIQPASEHADSLLLGAPMASYVTEPTYVLTAATSTPSVIEMPTVLDTFSSSEGGTSATLYCTQPVTYSQSVTAFNGQVYSYNSREESSFPPSPSQADQLPVLEESREEAAQPGTGDGETSAAGQAASPAGKEPVTEGRSPSPQLTTQDTEHSQ